MTQVERLSGRFWISKYEFESPLGVSLLLMVLKPLLRSMGEDNLGRNYSTRNFIIEL